MFGFDVVAGPVVVAAAAVVVAAAAVVAVSVVGSIVRWAKTVERSSGGAAERACARAGCQGVSDQIRPCLRCSSCFHSPATHCFGENPYCRACS
jgi:hypothetical protein